MSIFSTIAARRPKSSDFNLSHTRKFSFSPGWCTPTLCQEILPSDRWDYNMSALVKFQPMLAPIMHMVDVYNYSFFVPCRLTMERGAFEVFITGGPKGDGKDSAGNTIEIPYATFNRKDPNGAPPVSSVASLNWSYLTNNGSGLRLNNLADFLGFQFDYDTAASFANSTFRVNMQPFIAFWKIWNQYFRDQNLQDDVEQIYPAVFNGKGDITAALFNSLTVAQPGATETWSFFTIPLVCWEKDYFTSALPFAQRGNPVETPLSGTATVNYRKPAIIRRNTGAAETADGLMGTLAIAGDGRMMTNKANAAGAGAEGYLDNIESVELESGGFTINQLRLSARLQEWLEKMARGGARYIEQIKAHFGVTSSDARLQRPEFLGGGKIPVHFSEVLQTSENGETPLANMAGHGVSAGNVNHFRRFFEEHGFVISITFLRPRTAYQQGIPRLFTQRFDKLNWAWPSFAHLGEQEVLRQELFAQLGMGFGGDKDNDTFGYQSRYAEYKYIPSTVHGEFTSSLAFWHWGRKFDGEVETGDPELNSDFVACQPSLRIFNVTDASQTKLYAIVNNRINARRPLPYYSQPAL